MPKRMRKRSKAQRGREKKLSTEETMVIYYEFIQYFMYRLGDMKT